MLRTEVNVFTLVAAVLAATAAHFAPDAGWVLTAAGFLLVVTLFAFDRLDIRTLWQSIAFSGVTAYCLVLALLGCVVLARNFRPQDVPWPLPFVWQPAAWLVLLIVLTIIDRVRMDSRTPRGLFAQPQPTAPRPNLPAPLPPQVAVPVPAKGIAVKPIELPPNAGKPAMIYLNIVDAGVACLRAVKAEHLGRDFYRIVEPVPSDEKWEFSTGQVVRCQKRTLSNGKALVAIEEAPRAIPS